jgi:hypothetical protein
VAVVLDGHEDGTSAGCARVDIAEVRGWIKSTIEARRGHSEPIRDSGARSGDSGGIEYSSARGIHDSAASAAGSQQALAPRVWRDAAPSMNPVRCL